MLHADQEIDVPAVVRADALKHGIELPAARPRLAPWAPDYANEYSPKRGPHDRTALPQDPIVIEADMPPCDQQALWRAAHRAGVSHRLCTEEPRYGGYRWYDQLPKATKLTTTVILDGKELQIESQRRKVDPLDTGRPEAIAFTLKTIDSDGAAGRMEIPGDVAFPDDDIGWAEDLTVLVTADSDITPDELAGLLYDAFFSPSDDCEADSYETQKDNYWQAALAKALELLASAREAMLSNVRAAVWRAVEPCLPPRSNATIRIHRDKPIEITIETSDASTEPTATTAISARGCNRNERGVQE